MLDKVPESDIIPALIDCRAGISHGSGYNTHFHEEFLSNS